MARNLYFFFWDSDRDEQMVWIYQTINQVGLHLGDRDAQRALGSDNLPLTLVVPERISANHSHQTNH
jgi:hypothetical protein